MSGPPQDWTGVPIDNGSISVMGNCKDCRHWLEEDQWGACNLASSSRNEPDEPSTKAYARDYEDYGARLVTAPDFGCVQFEAKS